MANPVGTPLTAQETANRQAIIDILHQHCRGLDRCNSDTLLACYWPDAEVDYGNYKGSAAVFAELVVGALRDNYQITRHCIGNCQIQLRGNSARVESYVDAAHLHASGDGEMCFRGRYLDTLEKRDNQWRMLNRQVVMDWSYTRAFEDERDSEAFAALAKGCHDEQDPSMPFFQETKL